jgi:tRNA threonylcarbamoyladenosine biosynthesis protein TsaE
VNEYSGEFDIYHIDAYRLDSIGEFEMLGFDDFCHPRSVVLIEWADKIEAVLKAIDYVRIELAHEGETVRRIRIYNMPDYMLF